MTTATRTRSVPQNVGETERLASLLGGGLLMLKGLRQGSLTGLALATAGGALAYRGLSGHCEVYEALGVRTSEKPGQATSVRAGHGFKVERAVTINRPVAELYRYWRNFENLPRFMTHLEAVQVQGGNRSHWVARALGMRLEWDAEIIAEKEGELIAWRSLPGGDVDTAGSVHFSPAPAGKGTEIRVSLKYDPPAGKLGAWAAWAFGQAPEQQVREDLRRLKQLQEAGELPTVQGQPSGAR